MAIAFKPSQVFLYAGPPLTATMNKTEVETAAALLVRVCHDHGDAWQPVTTEMLRKTVDGDVEAGRDPVASWVRNPFLVPDMDGLVRGGFARWGTSGEGPIELTDAGLDALRPWVRR